MVDPCSFRYDEDSPPMAPFCPLEREESCVTDDDVSANHTTTSAPFIVQYLNVFIHHYAMHLLSCQCLLNVNLIL